MKLFYLSSVLFLWLTIQAEAQNYQARPPYFNNNGQRTSAEFNSLNSIFNPGYRSSNNVIGNTGYNTYGNPGSHIQNHPVYQYTNLGEQWPTTREGKEAQIETSRIFWAMAPEVAARQPRFFPDTPEGLRAQNDYLKDFWRQALPFQERALALSSNRCNCGGFRK